MRNNQAPNENQPQPPRPVAYDAEGRPLYAAPAPPPPKKPKKSRPRGKQVNNTSHVTQLQENVEGQNFNPQIRSQYANEPRVVHATRSHSTDPYKISDELKQLHEESCKNYPGLNLSEGEFVITKVTRHPIGLWIPTISTVSIIVLLMAALVAYPSIAADPVSGNVPGIISVTVLIMCLIVMVGIGGYIAVWVYLRNCFYLTNESIIQEIQISLFSRREQTVSLGSVEDASYRQNGIIPSLLNYGMIRLSTEGEETTYRFQYVENPKDQLSLLNNAVESFKNGRPIGMPKAERGDDF